MQSRIMGMPLAALALSLAAQTAAAGIVEVESHRSVAATMDALEQAVTEAGLSVAARIDHAAAAAKAGLELRPEQLLVFGNPKVGTPAMQADPRAGLFLPLRVVVYEDAAGRVWLAYEDPASMMEGLDIPPDAPFLATMTGALGKFTASAAGG
ncbi:DUF302 domain-containing protein [Albidovulum sp.]